MNLRVAMGSLDSAVPLRSGNPARKTRFHPRLEILDEVVAGFLWMQLDLPEDISHGELEGFAHRLVAVIQAGAGEAEIAAIIAELQFGQLCRPGNPAAIHDVARRAIATVKGAHPRI